MEADFAKNLSVQIDGGFVDESSETFLKFVLVK